MGQNEVIYQLDRIQLVKRIFNSGKKFFVKVGFSIPFETDDFNEAYRFYNTKAAEVPQKWGSFKTNYT